MNDRNFLATFLTGDIYEFAWLQDREDVEEWLEENKDNYTQIEVIEIIVKDIIYPSEKQIIYKNKYLDLHDLTKTITVDKVIMRKLDDEDKLTVKELLKRPVSHNFILYTLLKLFTNITSDNVDMETVGKILDDPDEKLKIVKERLNIIIEEVSK
jgi:hypothetical protein